jgi:hypothetical protein
LVKKIHGLLLSKALKAHQDARDKKNEAVILELQTEAERFQKINDAKDIEIQSLGKSLAEAQKLNKHVISEKNEYMQKVEEQNEELKRLMDESKREIKL